MAYDPWINCGVEGWVKWPERPSTACFDGRELRLLPPDPKHYQSVHVQVQRSRTSEEDGYTLINRYLSYRSWAEDQPIEVRFSWLGSPNPVPVLRGNQPRQLVSMALPNHRSHEDRRHALALALFREARNARSIPFTFLGYFKILNIFWKDKWANRANPIVEGIRESLPAIQGDRAKVRLNKLRRSESDIALYLYHSGRCAIAHANMEPVVDPDAATDTARLTEDLCIVKAIAERLIETQFNVSRSVEGYYGSQ